MATASNSIGSFRLFRQVRPRARWADPQTPVYDPCWIVEFNLPGLREKRESSKLPICRLCLADPSPLKNRPGCRVENCQADVQRWASVRLGELSGDWKAGRLDAGQGRPSQRLSLEDVRALYEQTGPDDRTKNLRALEMVTCEVLGRTWKEVYLDEFSPDWWDRFAWMYQEAERRGWLKRDGKKPDDYLQQLRRACPEHPMVDRSCATSGNGTIRSTMRKAKAVLGQESQDHYLKPLRDRFPTSPGFLRWQKTKVTVRTLDSRFDLDPEVYEAMWESLPTLRQDDPQVWALIRLHWTTGVRPIEAEHARTTWLEVEPESGRVLIVIRNRPDEGFTLKDADTRQSRPWPLPTDLVELLPHIAIPGGSIFGCQNPGQWNKIYRRANAWLRSCGVPGQHTLYNLRKLVATVKVALEGQDAAAAALGHKHATTTMGFYAGQSQVITPLSDADLAPTAVLGMRRKPWVIA